MTDFYRDSVKRGKAIRFFRSAVFFCLLQNVTYGCFQLLRLAARPVQGVSHANPQTIFGAHRCGCRGTRGRASLGFLLVLGTWELGRTVQVYQILNDAAREGARLAAQGQIINLEGSYTQINVNTGSPDVFDAVKNTLSAAGNRHGVFRHEQGDIYFRR